jgi:hypothetical protein
MTRDEQKQILALIDRAVGENSCVPARPMDVEADAIIRALFVRNPEAAYRVTMLAITQEREIEALLAAPLAVEQPTAPKLFSRLFQKRTVSRTSHDHHLGAMEQPLSG